MQLLHILQPVCEQLRRPAGQEPGGVYSPCGGYPDILPTALLSRGSARRLQLEEPQPGPATAQEAVRQAAGQRLRHRMT